MAVGINAYANFIIHKKTSKVNLNVGILFSIIGSIGVFLGATLGLVTSSRNLLFLFSILMIVIGIYMYIQKSRENSKVKKVDVSDGKTSETAKVGTYSVLTGFASGFFGIGGGFLIVPSIMYSKRISINEAVGTSLLVVGTFGMLTAIRYAFSGDVIYSVSMLYIIGGVFGGIIGTKISVGLNTNFLRKIFSVVIIVVGIYVMVKTFT